MSMRADHDEGILCGVCGLHQRPVLEGLDRPARRSYAEEEDAPSPVRRRRNGANRAMGRVPSRRLVALNRRVQRSPSPGAVRAQPSRRVRHRGQCHTAVTKRVGRLSDLRGLTAAVRARALDWARWWDDHRGTKSERLVSVRAVACYFVAAWEEGAVLFDVDADACLALWCDEVVDASRCETLDQVVSVARNAVQRAVWYMVDTPRGSTVPVAVPPRTVCDTVMSQARTLVDAAVPTSALRTTVGARLGRLVDVLRRGWPVSALRAHAVLPWVIRVERSGDGLGDRSTVRTSVNVLAAACVGTVLLCPWDPARATAIDVRSRIMRMLEVLLRPAQVAAMYKTVEELAVATANASRLPGWK